MKLIKFSPIFILFLTLSLTAQKPSVFERYSQESLYGSPLDFIQTEDGYIFTELSVIDKSDYRLYISKYDKSGKRDSFFFMDIVDKKIGFINLTYMDGKVSAVVHDAIPDGCFCGTGLYPTSFVIYDLLGEKKYYGMRSHDSYNFNNFQAKVQDTVIHAQYESWQQTTMLYSTVSTFNLIATIPNGFAIIDNDKYFFTFRQDSIFFVNSKFETSFFKKLPSPSNITIDFQIKKKNGFVYQGIDSVLYYLDFNFNVVDQVDLPHDIDFGKILQYADGHFLYKSSDGLYYIKNDGSYQKLWTPLTHEYIAEVNSDGTYSILYKRDENPQLIVNELDNIPVFNYPSLEFRDIQMFILPSSGNYTKNIGFTLEITNNGNLDVNSTHLIIKPKGGLLKCTTPVFSFPVNAFIGVDKSITFSDSFTINDAYTQCEFIIKGADFMPLEFGGIKETLTLDLLNSTDENDWAKLLIYPNPTNDYFVIKNDNGISEVKVFDNLGRVVINSKHDKGKIYHLDGFENGLYFIETKLTNHQKRIQKLIINKI